MAPPARKRRIHPQHLALAVLFAGWVPTILLALVSYSTLSKTLEREIIVDRRTVVGTLSSLIGYDLVRTGEVIEHYQTLPDTALMLSKEPGDLTAQDWLASIYYGQPRIDGMFLAKPDGTIIAALPRDELMVGEKYAEGAMLGHAAQASPYYIAPVHARAPDSRKVTAIVAPVRSSDGDLLGFVGAQILVERLGRRLREYSFGEASEAQVIDQTGTALFNPDFSPRQSSNPAPDDLMTLLKQDPDGVFRFQHDLYTAHTVADSPWVALLRQPLSVAYRPIRELLTKTALLSAWLIVGTAIIALLVSRLYGYQLAADERIQREMLFSEKMLATMPLGIGVFDPVTTGLLKSNESFIEMLKEFAGLTKSPEAIRFSDLTFAAREIFDKTVAHVAAFQAREIKVTSRDGRTHFIAFNMFPIQAPGGGTQGLLCLMEDTTGDAMVRQELIAANVTKDQFLALLSHELRNPLTPVITMVSHLRDKLEDDPEALNALEVIRRNVELEARLIDDLLDVTRISHNKMKLAVETVDAHQIIQRAVEICESDLKSRRIRLELKLEAARHHLHADPARLQQVFWNLVKNSVKFTPVEGSIALQTVNEGERLVVTVKDSGIGITADRLDKIFNPFEQGDVSVTRRFGGLGLGLAITQALVHAHGGTIAAASEGEGKGATFTLEFDTAPEPEEKIPAVQPQSPPRDREGRQRRILLVDDHADTCMGMERLLTKRGYAVRTAGTVADALELAHREAFDLVISDLGLPDGTGFDLMESLQNEHQMRGIAVSGFGAENDLEKSRRAGFSEHLIKPVSLDRLEAALHAVFSDS